MILVMGIAAVVMPAVIGGRTGCAAGSLEGTATFVA